MRSPLLLPPTLILTLTFKGAHAVTLNLLGGVRANRRDRPHESNPEALALWEKQEEERRTTFRTSERVLQLMHRKHLQKYMPALGELEAYKEVTIITRWRRVCLVVLATFI